MLKKKELILDPTTGELSRLSSEILPLVSINGLTEDGHIPPFGESPLDIIEFHLYDINDNYKASGEISYPLPDTLDIGAHVRGLGYERGTYKIVYNFLRQLGGSDKIVLVKKEDRSIYLDSYWVDTNGKIYAGTLEEPLKDDDDNFIELLIQDDKFWLQEISPSRTEIRLRPNPAINDDEYYEQFRLICYDCLAYTILGGDSYLTFDNTKKIVTVNSTAGIQLSKVMDGGILIINDAFVVGYEATDESIVRYNPIIETETFPISQNLVTNGHFFNGIDISERGSISNNHEIIKFSNPGNSAWCLKTTSNDSNNRYEIDLEGIPGETYIMSCWVHWDEDWPGERHGLFRGKINSGDGFQSIENQIPPYDVVKEKIVDGKIWSHQYKIITIPENSNGTIKWFLGKTDSFNSNDQNSIRYITNIQFEPGSISGNPSPFMISSRIEDTDIPVTGLITFEDDGKTLTATFSDEDGGFVSEMISDSNGRESGKITIKDAFVIDEVFSEDTEVIVIDDIPLKNPLATDIKKYEREFLVSPFHGSGNNKIILRVDNNYTLTSFDSNESGSVIGSSVGVAGAYKESYIHNLPDNLARLEILTHNGTGGAGFVAKIFWNGSIIKTGDGRASYTDQKEVDWKSDLYDEESAEDIPEYITTFTESSGPWEIISNTTNSTDLDWKKTGGGDSNIHNQLKDCDWIWSSVRSDNQDLVWTWTAESSVVDLIWQYWDPILHSDAVKPEGWGTGFNAFNWGGNEDRKNDRSRWHSGWLGYHAKWVEGEGQHGDTCMKFIDHNSEFGTPNHNDYPLSSPHRTGHYTGNDLPSLTHRWLGIAQTLPHTMAAQGIEPGDNITISWWQKSDIFGKGAMVGLRHYQISDGEASWGNWIGYHPATLEEGMQRAGEREFRRYIPCSKVGEWEQVSYTAEVEDDWDLTKSTRVYVYGQYGPEGVLLVENVQIQRTTSSITINKIPITSDLVAEIDLVVDKNTIILKDTYENLVPEGIVTTSAANIRPWNNFPDFYVDYTASISTSDPIFGTLRGEIVNVSGDSITLLNSYDELGSEAGHDFDSYTLQDMQFRDDENSNGFEKWFIQAPRDKSEDLSKLIKFGQNHFSLITNFKLDTVTYPEYPYSAVYKLYEPLPDNIVVSDFCSVVKEMIPPIEEICTLIPFIEEEISDIVLRIPEPGNVNSIIGTGQTEFKGYSSLTTTDISLKESIENELISGSLSIDINIDHSLFDNFIHFGSAEKRIRNFKYKLDQIEQYTDRSASLAGAGSGSTGLHSVVADPVAGAYLNVSGSEDPHPPFTPVSGSTTQIVWWEQKRRETINSFDKFEKYMFKQSSSYSSESIGVFHDNAWPKRSGLGTYLDPYVLARTSQSIATTWYDNQLVSASVYDKQNMNRLRVNLPTFIQDDDENIVFLNFIDMIGHYFDDIWTFIKAMTDVHDRRDGVDSGLSKDLLKPVAQSLGWEVFDGKDLISLPRYMFGMEQTGSEKPWQYSGTSDRDISREIWSRIINNMPYFLKTKGTARAIKGLISCYGIPSSILRVVEYGGPKLPGQPAEYFLTRKFTKALNFFGAPNNTYVQNDTWEAVTLGDAPTSRVPDTVEFRFKAASGSNQVLVRRGDDWAIRLKDNGSSDRFGYVSFMLSGSRGYNEVTSSELPVYDGEFWSVMLTRTSASGYHLSDDNTSQDVVYTLYTKQYNAGRSKIIYESSSPLIVSGGLGAVSQSYNSAYIGTSDTITIGGPESDYFGESFSGSMMEYRNWTTPLIESAFDNHVSAPITFNGNTPSASFLDLVTRYSFDDNKDLSIGANQWFQDASADQSFTSSVVPHNYTSGMGDHFSSVVDETKMKIPNLGPSGRSSRKIRIEADTLIDKVSNPVLKFGESITTPAYDNAPIDSNKLGIYFSPSAPIDEDIISSMPDLDFDQYIGDPRDQYKEQYTGLVEVRNLYWQKYSGPNNFWDYLRLLKYYDSSLYKQIKTLVPARANATVGILIEPTILERDKIVIGKKPIFEPQHHTTFIDTKIYISESADYPNYDADVNFSNPFEVNFHTQETGSYISASSQYELLETDLNYSHPFRVNFYTEETGSFISSSAKYEDLTTNINLYNPFLLNNITQQTGSGILVTADFNSYSAPSYTFSEIASGTGSFVMKHILERPAIYNIGDRDTSGWYGSDYYNATIQAGSQKSIYEEVVMPRIEINVLSQFNDETEYFYSSSLSASMHIPYSSSFVRSDLDNKWDEFLGTDRLFYLGCVQTDNTTVSDNGNRYEDNSPAVDITITSPTRLVTTDSPTTPLEVTG